MSNSFHIDFPAFRHHQSIQFHAIQFQCLAELLSAFVYICLSTSGGQHFFKVPDSDLQFAIFFLQLKILDWLVFPCITYQLKILFF